MLLSIVCTGHTKVPVKYSHLLNMMRIANSDTELH
jgi:hypothetical protein